MLYCLALIPVLNPKLLGQIWLDEEEDDNKSCPRLFGITTCVALSMVGDHYGYVAAIQHIITSSQFFTVNYLIEMKMKWKTKHHPFYVK